MLALVVRTLALGVLIRLQVGLFPPSQCLRFEKTLPGEAIAGECVAYILVELNSI
jgi:hypothetical protein